MFSRLCQRRLLLTAPGAVLCLLAALFAIEAKVAWFSPAGSPSAQISAAKLQPTDAPRHIAQALTAPDLLHFSPEIPLLLLLLALLMAAPAVFHSANDRVAIASPGFYSSLFRRPPPQR
jgi:hypothetical protein